MGSSSWSFIFSPIKKEVFIKQQTVVKHGSKLCMLTVTLVQLKWTLIRKNQMNCMLLCGIKQGVPGILKKEERQAAYIKAVTSGDTWKSISGSGFPNGDSVGRIGRCVYPKNPQIVYAVVDNQKKQHLIRQEEIHQLT
jgi:hypothetical protein